MSASINTISEVYIALEEGNIGKLLTILSSSLKVYTASCMGGGISACEAILKQIHTFYRPGSAIKKTVGCMIEHDNMVIVPGNISINGIDSMPCADIWHFEHNKPSYVIFYYKDPTELSEYLQR
jgi:hypothetical protein